MNKFIQKIKSKATKNKTLIQNFSYLSVLQMFNMLLPLVTYPYLIRILSAELYGQVIFAQIVATYFGILIDFGFKTSATKDISINRDNKSKLSEIVSSVISIKIILWILSLGLIIVLIYSIPYFQTEKLLYLLSFSLCFNELLFPQWYFQGIERMKYITIINLIARFIFLALIFIVVKEKSDYLLVPALNGIGALIGGILGLYVLLVKDKIAFSIQPIKTLKYHFKESYPLFWSNAIISIKDRFNVIFIGMFLGMRDVAIYDLSIKIMKLFMHPIDIVNRTLYPRVAKDKNPQIALKLGKFVFLIMFTLIVIIQPFLAPIINFLSEGLNEAITPTRILLISPLIMVWSLSLAVNCINALGKYKLLLNGILFTTISYLALITIGYIFDLHKTLNFYIYVVVGVYLLELLYRIFIVKKHKLLQSHDIKTHKC